MLKVASLFVSIILLLGPQSLDRTKHLFIHKPIEIELEQRSPAVVALRMISQAPSLEAALAVTEPLESSTQLLAGLKVNADSSLNSTSGSFQKTERPKQKEVENFYGLTEQEKLRLNLAQQTHGEIEQVWNVPTVSTKLAELIQQIPDELKNTEKALTYLAPNQYKIRGPLEIAGGLAVTDVNRIEVKRQKEGVGFETGLVNLQEGVYEIIVNGLEGTLRAKLVDGSGQVLGEDSIRLAGLLPDQKVISGPSLKLMPRAKFGGVIRGAQKSDSGKSESFSVSALDGNIKGEMSESGDFKFQQLAKKSQTIASFTQGSFELIQLSTDDALEIEYMSEKSLEMILELINEQRLTEKKVLKSDGRIIYGRVKNQAISSNHGELVIEQFPNLKPIYFNDFFFPDIQQTKLSANGYFIFLDVPVGMLSLLHKVEGRIYGFANTVVAPHSISSVSIISQLPTVEAPVRYFDAFTGFDIRGEIEFQGREEALQVENGTESVRLRDVSTYALAKAYPKANDYLRTNHIYNDRDEYLHFPTISKEWLSSTLQNMNMQNNEDTTAVIGFVPFSNFKVYLVDESKGQEQLAYFDYRGDLTADKMGQAGGGFLISNLPEGVVEIVVEFEGSDELHSRVIPVFQGEVSVVQVK